MENGKRCIGCSRVLPAGRFTTYVSTSGNTLLVSRCKECRAAAYRKQKECVSRRRAPAKITNGMKVCTSCQQDLPIAKYRTYVHRDKPTMEAQCVDCLRAKQREWKRTRPQLKAGTALDAEQTRACPECRTELPIHRFRRTKKGPRQKYCMPCSRTRTDRQFEEQQADKLKQVDARYDYSFARSVLHLPRGKAIDWIAHGYRVAPEIAWRWADQFDETAWQPDYVKGGKP